MMIPINFALFLQNHPFHNQTKSLVGEPMKKLIEDNKWMTCAIQISYALNHSGAPIEASATKYYTPPPIGQYVRLFPQEGSEKYIISVQDMGAYLNGRYFVGENYKGSKEAMVAEIEGRQGIIRFGDDHVDVWEGSRFHQEHTSLPDSWATSVSNAGAWGAPSVSQVGIFFWGVGVREHEPRVEQRP